MKVKFGRYLFLFCLFCLSTLRGWSQQDIGVSVRINRLPTGAYPTKLFQFSNSPGLVMVTLSNHDNATNNVFLNGALTGDNGVQIITAKGYQPASITLKPFETRILNAVEVGNLFDPNSLIYLSGSSSIKPSVFGEQGLPEGTYQVCVRAFDAATRRPLSAEDPIGCSNIFTVSTLEPPVILNPFNDDSLSTLGPQDITLRWTTPPGAPPSTQYTIRIVEMFGANNNPNNALLSTSTPFFETTVQGAPLFLYSPAYPQLQPGRSYAMMVTARDLSGVATFRNNGQSEAIQFTYGAAPIAAFEFLSLHTNGLPTCSCQQPPSNLPLLDDVSAIQPGATLKVDGFDMVLTQVSSNSGGKLSGEGKIKVPILNLIPVSVQFQDIRINAGNQLVTGTVTGKQRGDAASLLPAYDPTQPNLVIDPNNAQNFGQYISNYIASTLNPAEALGYSLPIGLDNAGSSGSSLAITNITFWPDRAAFDAGATFEVPEASMTVALGGRNICFSPGTAVCGQGMVYLEKDLAIGTTGIALKGPDATDSGTLVVFGPEGFDHMRIRGQYTFPGGMLEKIGGGGPVTASLTVATTAGWSDWIASVNVDPFQIAGNNNFGFLPGAGFYDHSDKSNPVGMPANYPDAIEPTWHGFFLPQLQVQLPSIVKQFAGNSRLQGSAQNFIIDGQGVTGTIGIDSLLTIDQGNLDSWQYSVDRIEAVFTKNSFTGGDMRGRVLLPLSDPSDPTAPIDYTCTMTDTAALKFHFLLKPERPIVVPMWLMTLTLSTTSSINVNEDASSTGFLATAVLDGNMTFNTSLPDGLGNVSLQLIAFQHLTINSQAPYISDGDLIFGQSSPAKSVNGFPVSFRENPSFTTDRLGIEVPLRISLCDLPGSPVADFSFTVTGGFIMDNGRLRTVKPVFTITSVGVSGTLGPLTLSGSVSFFQNDPKFGNGLSGALQARFPPGFTTSAQVLFGKQDFYYFFVDARFQVPPPSGFPIGGEVIPLVIYGFGGGAYYNLSLNVDPTKVQDMTITDVEKIRQLYDLRSGSVGIRASIDVATTDGSLWGASGTLTAEANINGGFTLQQLAIEVDAGMFTPALPGGQAPDYTKAPIQGHGIIDYDFTQDQLFAGITMNINTPGGFDKASGTLALLINGQHKEWYLKIGDAADEGKRVSLSMFLGLISFGAYFNIGNQLTLPPELQAAYAAVYPGGSQNSAGKIQGILFGADAKFINLDMAFLIFYLKVQAYFGFDMALLHNTAACSNGQVPGLNGYYALGRITGGATFDLSLDLNLWFHHGRVTLVGLSATLDFTAGLPNPFWFDGWLESKFNFFGGLIQGDMNFHAKFSTDNGQCVLEANPFGSLPLISDLLPHDGDQGVSIFISVGAAFNFPVNQSFLLTYQDSNGNSQTKQLMVVIRNFSIKNNTTQHVYSATMDVNGNMWSTSDSGKINAVDHNAWLYGWTQTLDPQKSFTISITADGYQNNGNWQLVPGASQTVTNTFTTGECAKTLTDQGAVLTSYPFPNQRYFLPQHYATGYIYLKLGTDCLQQPPPKKTGISGFASINDQVEGYSLLATFTSLTDYFESPITNVGQNLNFSIPPQLSPSTIYKLRIIKRPIFPPAMKFSDVFTVPGQQPVTLRNIMLAASTPANLSNANLQKNTLLIPNYQAIAALSTAKPSDIEIYSYFFKTSKYKTLQEKMSGTGQSGGASYGLGIPNFQLIIHEGLDVYDAVGLVVDGSGGRTTSGMDVFIPPIVNLNDQYGSNAWMQQVIEPIMNQYDQLVPFDAQAQYDIQYRSISPEGGGLDFVKGLEPFSISGYEQPLQPTEIPVGLKVPFYITAPNLNQFNSGSGTPPLLQQPVHNTITQPLLPSINKPNSNDVIH